MGDGKRRVLLGPCPVQGMGQEGEAGEEEEEEGAQPAHPDACATPELFLPG